jgi:hypothetical protein
MVCYLCGLEFDTRVLNKHEDDCFKQWRKWNDSLPTEQRRPEPERPQFKFNKGHSLLLMPAYCHVTGGCGQSSWGQFDVARRRVEDNIKMGLSKVDCQH